MSTTPGPLDGYTVAAPNCPPWCDRDHPALLSDRPTASLDVAPYVLHTCHLATAGPLEIRYGLADALEPGPLEGPCFVHIWQAGRIVAALEATPADLRQWASTLTTAATAAEQIGTPA